MEGDAYCVLCGMQCALCGVGRALVVSSHRPDRPRLARLACSLMLFFRVTHAGTPLSSLYFLITIAAPLFTQRKRVRRSVHWSSHSPHGLLVQPPQFRLPGSPSALGRCKTRRASPRARKASGASS